MCAIAYRVRCARRSVSMLASGHRPSRWLDAQPGQREMRSVSRRGILRALYWQLHTGTGRSTVKFYLTHFQFHLACFTLKDRTTEQTFREKPEHVSQEKFFAKDN